MSNLQCQFAEVARALALTDAELELVLATQRGLELIYLARALTGVFPGERAATWMRRKNEAFGGRTPIDMLLSSDHEDATQVRRYAEYWAYNGW